MTGREPLAEPQKQNLNICSDMGHATSSNTAYQSRKPSVQTDVTKYEIQSSDTEGPRRGTPVNSHTVHHSAL